VLPVVERGLDLISRGEAEGPGGANSASSLVSSNAGRIIGDLLKGVLSSGLAFFNLLSLIFITPVVTFYLLRDWDHIIAKVDSWLPRHHRATIHEQLHEIDEALAGFLRGQTLVGLVLAVLFSVSLSLAGLQFALVIGIFSGLITFIPFAGFILGFAVALLFALLQWGGDFVNVGIIVAIYVVLQVVESAVLTPKLVGSRVGLHPVWIIFSVLAAGVLFGFVGVLVAVPLAAVIGILIRFTIGQYLGSPIYLGTGRSEGEPGPGSVGAGKAEE
jgi:predicted PurR-regulated permease PerM